ncbi:MAG: hypothetical protein COB02_02720 [Candidatus Cloacimonadota bacterium]|nr:MAG: hypothetical protein COB02_02720 [Candidatus Cloacimonadota bacterium]
MNKLILLLFFLNFTISHSFQNDSSDLYVKNLFQVLDSFSKHHFIQSSQYFSDNFQKEALIKSLQNTWLYQEKKHGPFQEILYFTKKKGDNSLTLKVLVQMKNQKLALQFNFFYNAKIKSFQFIDTSEIKPPEYKTPPYVKKQKFHFELIEFGGKSSPLQAKVYLPNDTKVTNTLLFLHDFGPQNLYHKTGVNPYYRDIAEGLASNSIASFLFNKRSYIYQAQTKKALTPAWEILRDLYGAIFKIRSHPQLKNTQITLVLNGFSSYFSSYLATQKVFDQFILLNPSFRHPLYTLFEKEEFFLNNKNNSEKLLLSLHQRIENFFKSKKSLNEDFFSYPSSYFKKLTKYQPKKINSNISTEFLLLNAGEDYSQNPSDIPIFEDILETQKVTTYNFPELNHIFHVGQVLQTKQNLHTKGIVSARVILIIKNWIESKN